MLRSALTLRNILYIMYRIPRFNRGIGNRWHGPSRGSSVRTCNVDGMQRGVGPCMRRNGLQTPKTRLLPPLRRWLAPEPDATLPAGTGKWPRHRLSRKLGWHSAGPPNIRFPASQQMSVTQQSGMRETCHSATDYLPISSSRMRVQPGQRSQVHQQLSVAQISLLGS